MEFNISDKKYTRAAIIALLYCYCLFFIEDLRDCFPYVLEFIKILLPTLTVFFIERWIRKKYSLKKLRKKIDFAEYLIRWILINHLLGGTIASIILKLLAKHVPIKGFIAWPLAYFVIFLVFFFSSLLALQKIETKKNLVFKKAKLNKKRYKKLLTTN